MGCFYVGVEGFFGIKDTFWICSQKLLYMESAQCFFWFFLYLSVRIFYQKTWNEMKIAAWNRE